MSSDRIHSQEKGIRLIVPASASKVDTTIVVNSGTFFVLWAMGLAGIAVNIAVGIHIDAKFGGTTEYWRRDMLIPSPGADDSWHKEWIHGLIGNDGANFKTVTTLDNAADRLNAGTNLYIDYEIINT